MLDFGLRNKTGNSIARFAPDHSCGRILMPDAATMLNNVTLKLNSGNSSRCLLANCASPKIYATHMVNLALAELLSLMKTTRKSWVARRDRGSLSDP